MVSLNGATLSTPFNHTFNSVQVTFYKTQQKSTKEKIEENLENE